MSWVKIEDNLYAKEPDKDPELIVTKEELEKEKQEINSELETIPDIPEDNSLLAWAKLNYPFFNQEEKRAKLLSRLEEINNILAL